MSESCDSIQKVRKGRGKEKERDIELPMEEIMNAIPKKALAMLKQKYAGPDQRGIKPDKPRSEKQLANDQRLRESAKARSNARYEQLEALKKEGGGNKPIFITGKGKEVEEQVEEKIVKSVKVPKSYLTKVSGNNSHVNKKYKELENKLEDTKKIVDKQVEEIPKIVAKVKKVIDAITPPASPKYPSTASVTPPPSVPKNVTLQDLVNRRMGIRN